MVYSDHLFQVLGPVSNYIVSKISSEQWNLFFHSFLFSRRSPLRETFLLIFNPEPFVFSSAV
jgi:hypothetical protein